LIIIQIYVLYPLLSELSANLIVLNKYLEVLLNNSVIDQIVQNGQDILSLIYGYKYNPFIQPDNIIEIYNTRTIILNFCFLWV